MKITARHDRTAVRGRGGPALARLGEALVLAAVLAFGVIAWRQAVHGYALGHSDTLAVDTWLRDGLLAFPEALAAAVLAGLWTRMLRLGSSTADLLARASLASLFFALLLALSAPVHAQIDASAAEPAAGATAEVIHGVHDAFIGEVAALPLAAGGILLLSMAARRRG